MMLILILSACGGNGQKVGAVKISGVVKNPVQDGKIVLEKLSFTSTERVDSINIDGNEFSFYLAEAEQSFYRINFFDMQYVPFIVGFDDKDIRITVDGDRASGEFDVKGSAATDQKDEADSIMRSFNQRVQMLNQEAMIARNSNNPGQFQDVVERMRALERTKTKELKRIVWEYAPSVSSVYALNYIDVEQEFPFIDSVANKFADKLPDSEYTVALQEQVKKFSLLAVGSEAPEISLPDPDGNVITLSSLRGKYVLIDFWAAWCKPCRAENPNVKKVYAQYNDKGFEILGVSLDRKKEHWVQAIEQDGLPWMHVSDLKYFRSEAAETYKISSIPATYLIDPEGKIVAKGLRGASLRAKLAEIFG